MLRPSTPDDAPFIGELAEQVFSVYSIRPRRSVLEMLDEPGTLGVVAEEDGEKVGFGVVTFEILNRDFGPIETPVIAHLDAIAVSGSVRGLGVGRLLLTYVIDLARKNRAVTIALRTAETNQAARRLFDAFGFLTAATIGPHYAKGQSAVAMFKPLAIAR